MSFVLRRAAYTIAGVGQNTVAEVIDAHLETVSMIFLTTIWAITYGWFEGQGQIAHEIHNYFTFVNLGWIGVLSTYHLVIGASVFAISFSFGFLKFTRMLFARKRYMMFTALGNYAYAVALEDFSYFFFAPYTTLDSRSWTCSVFGLGCVQVVNPWIYGATIVIPGWYFVAFGFSAVMFFLAYRSALVNLLVTRQVMKQAGFLEKTRVTIPSESHQKRPQEEEPSPPAVTQSPKAETPPVTRQVEEAAPAPQPTLAVEPGETKAEKRAATIVDADRGELIRKLREKLERQGA